MITKRIIPCLDVDKGRVVKGKQFIEIQDAGDPVQLAKLYANQGADEVVILDITASLEARGTFLHTVEAVCKKLFVPLTVGGGVRTVADMRKLLMAGADKIAINSAAIADPKIISEAADMFGSQCIVIAMDVKRTSSGWTVYSHGGTRPTDLDALEWALRTQELGAGEILLTSIDRDGTRSGYDIELLQCAVSRLKIPVIASGGVGKWEDIRDAFLLGNADAALMASIVHFGEMTIPQIKTLLKDSGVSVR